jgi:hypothetical protein
MFLAKAACYKAQCQDRFKALQEVWLEQRESQVSHIERWAWAHNSYEELVLLSSITDIKCFAHHIQINYFQGFLLFFSCYF